MLAVAAPAESEKFQKNRALAAAGVVDRFFRVPDAPRFSRKLPFRFCARLRHGPGCAGGHARGWLHPGPTLPYGALSYGCGHAECVAHARARSPLEGCETRQLPRDAQKGDYAALESVRPSPPVLRHHRPARHRRRPASDEKCARSFWLPGGMGAAGIRGSGRNPKNYEKSEPLGEK